MAGRRIAGGVLVLDAEGLSKLAAGDTRARGYLDSARARGARVAVSALTLTEALRGGPRDAALHRVLARIAVVPVTAAIARRRRDRATSRRVARELPAFRVIAAPSMPPSLPQRLTWNVRSCC